MAQEYKITKVSKGAPREWPNPHGGKVYYIKVMLEGHNKPVSIGKKAPDALKEGYTVYGTIEPSDLPEDKFKAEVKPEVTYSQDKQDDKYWETKNNAIKAQFAIKAAVELLKNPKAEIAEETVEHWANIFYKMVDRITSSQPSQEGQGFDEDFESPHLDPPEINDPSEEPINMDEIPF